MDSDPLDVESDFDLDVELARLDQVDSIIQDITNQIEQLEKLIYDTQRKTGQVQST